MANTAARASGDLVAGDDLRPLPNSPRSGATRLQPRFPVVSSRKMAAIGRALISNPRILLCDEISLGLAPIVIRDIYAIFSAASARPAHPSSSSSRTLAKR